MTAILFAALGVLLGLGHFGSLRWVSLRLVESPGQGCAWLRLALVHALRLLVLAGVFFWASRQGALALVMLAAGVLGVRFVWVFAARRAERGRT